ncbi:hypothetical protein SAY87_023356 [Trapa incisa]|uniref:E2 ubiquitin-conjugating enzyme n=1 Tax=Trapa incisa TaxID=236973 RepID=A0AAN7KBT7_9MYRT|nr:hypothetical protein SAY87_023356 [Trapa incisa]
MEALFTESDWDSFSENSEDQEALDLFYGNQARNLLSGLEESIGKIDDFLSFERGFQHGDIVCAEDDLSGQAGKVVKVDMSVDLESTDGKVIRDVDSKKISRIRSICIDDYVVREHWLGRVEKVIDSVSIVFDNGARCDITALDEESIFPTSPSPVDDPQFPFYPGQRVQVKMPVVSKHGRWLCRSWRPSHEEGTVCALKAAFVHVKWLGSALSNVGLTLPLPIPKKLQEAESLTVLSCFSHSNWQMADWCSFQVDKKLLTHEASVSGIQRTNLNLDSEAAFIISRVKTRVDVLWQDGTYSQGVESQSLLPVNIRDPHEFWPEQFVLMKTGYEDPESTMSQKWGIVRSMDSKEKTAKVAWKNNFAEEANGHGEETMSTYELIEHPNYSFCLGDIVFRYAHEPHSMLKGKEGDAEDSNLSSIGNVVGFKLGTVEVKWATGITTKVAPCEIFRWDMYAESMVPLEDHDDLDGEQIVDDTRQSYDSKGKDWISYYPLNSEQSQKYPWDATLLSLPRSAIGILTGFASKLFRSSAASTSELGSSLSSPMHEARGPQKSNIDKASAEVISPGVEMKMVLPEGMEKIEDLPEIEKRQDQIMHEEKNKQKFKQFDLVDDCSDHFFHNEADKDLGLSQVQRAWFKKVQHEWNILEKSLPEMIYIRAYEERMDLMRAAIIGVPRTPYHDGIFFFDIFLPPEYPNVPPMVHYHSGGLRLNPNLYESGKVCLSLLNTWTGTGSEVWNPQSSTVLQVLVSLQSLVLNDRPYFNEAGYDKQVGKPEGEKNSVSYNENAFILTCRSMLYILRKPPKHFEALVLEHFGNRYRNILLACKEYMEGGSVGFHLGHGIDGTDGTNKRSSMGFKIMLEKLYPKLVETFQEKGLDCNWFTVP